MWSKQNRNVVWIEIWQHEISGAELVFVVDDFGNLTANTFIQQIKFSLFSDTKEV